MLSKAIIVDFKADGIPDQYLQRIKKIFKSVHFVSRDDPKLSTLLKDVDAALVTISTKVNKEFLDAAPKLKYVGVCSTAFDAVDAKYARARNVTVCNLGGYSTGAVSEFFFAALFEQARELEKAKQQARKEDYSFHKFMGLELRNKVLGVVGAGKIGGRIAEIGLGIGMKVICFSRKNKPQLDKLGAKKSNLDQMLSKSDFVSLNLALNKETEGIISKDKLKILKKNCILVNLAPPKLIDQEAVIKKASKGEMIFIFDHSDDIDKKLAKRFLKTKNCIVYPPVAFRTEEANTARWETFVSNITNFIKGKPKNVVN